MKQLLKSNLLLWLFFPILLFAKPWNSDGFPLMPAKKAGFSPEILAEMQMHLNRYVDEKKISGILTLIAREGSIVYQSQYGMQDIEANRPMAANTIFRLASMTKPITSVALMMLYEQGRVKLDDPVAMYIPAFSRAKVYGKNGKLLPLERPLRVKDVLTHTGGLTAGSFGKTAVHQLYREAKLNKAKTLGVFTEKLAAMPLLNQPGTGWNYGYSTDVVARIVEVVSGMLIHEFVTKHILEPLEMTDTRYLVPPEKRERFAAAYTNKDGKLSLFDSPVDGYFTKWPAFTRGINGLCGTAADYLKFAQMLLNEGTFRGKRLLKKETVALMRQNHLPEKLVPIQVLGAPMERNGFGLGFSIVVKQAGIKKASNSEGFWWNRGTPPEKTFWWVGAYQTYFWVDPENKIIGILMTQTPEVMRYAYMQEFHEWVYKAFRK